MLESVTCATVVVNVVANGPTTLAVNCVEVVAVNAVGVPSFPVTDWDVVNVPAATVFDAKSNCCRPIAVTKYAIG